jgi:hypothetical protein
MASTSHPQKGRDGALSTLDAIIQVLSLAKDVCGIPPAQVALASAVILLTMIRVSSYLHTSRWRASDSRCLGYDGQRSGLCRSWAGLW